MKAELLKTLREEQAAAMLQTQQAAQRAATIASKAKEYGIPEKFATKLNIAQDADLDEYFKSARQELADAGFELSEAPAQGGGIPNSGDDIAKLINKGTEDIVKHQTSKKMPAGLHYDLNPMDVLKELCRFDTVYRLSGGFNFEDTNVPNGTMLMPLTPLHVDLKTRKASAVKNVKVVEKVTTGTKIKIAKGSLAYKGMHLGDGTSGATVSSINTNNEKYDELTMSAALAAEADAVLFEAVAADGTTPKATANFLNYAVTKVEPGATVTAIGRAYEVRESKLYVPISEKDKESLTSRFLFTI